MPPCGRSSRGVSFIVPPAILATVARGGTEIMGFYGSAGRFTAFIFGLIGSAIALIILVLWGTIHTAIGAFQDRPLARTGSAGDCS